MHLRKGIRWIRPLDLEGSGPGPCLSLMTFVLQFAGYAVSPGGLSLIALLQSVTHSFTCPAPGPALGAWAAERSRAWPAGPEANRLNVLC